MTMMMMDASGILVLVSVLIGNGDEVGREVQGGSMGFVCWRGGLSHFVLLFF